MHRDAYVSRHTGEYEYSPSGCTLLVESNDAADARGVDVLDTLEVENDVKTTAIEQLVFSNNG